MELKEQLDAILAQIKEQRTAGEAESKKFGTMLDETKAKLDALQRQADAIDVKLAESHAQRQPAETFTDALRKNEDVQAFLRRKNRSVMFEISAAHVSEIFERKTTITSPIVGLMTTGVLQIDRTPGIVAEARQALTLRNVLPSRPTTFQRIDFVKVATPMVLPSPNQTETVAKFEETVTFNTSKEDVQTLAAWIPASKQVIDDFTELEGYLRAALPYYVNLQEETQFLTGTGTGVELHGIIPQATAFNTGLVTGSWNRVDIIGRAIQQIQTAKELAPSFVVMHPADWWSVRLTKDSQGRYILGDPMGSVTTQDLFGLTPVITTTIGTGKFLIGSGSPAAIEIRDRMGMTVEISTEHDDYWVRNMVAIRAEKRVALVTYRPASFVTGTFTTSP